MKRRTFFKSAGASALAASMSGESFAAPAAGRPNILLITTDQQSWDAMSCTSGSKYLRTPAMDSLAKTGMNFSHAYCANPICVPSRTSMYTGRYPSETGVQHNDTTPIDSHKFPAMGTHFRKAGYNTAYFGKWHLPFKPEDVEAHGFSVVDPVRGGKDPGIAARAAAFLSGKPQGPFLMVTSLVNPHNICEWARGDKLPDGPIGDAPAPETCPPLRPNAEPQQNEPDIVTRMRKSYHGTRMFPVGNFDAGKWRQYIWAYYRMVEKVDALVGQVLDALRKAGLEENTLVVFLSDHGDCQGSHKWNQKTMLLDEAARVPLIVSYKGVTKTGVSSRLVNTGIDLIPTLCDYAGIPVPGTLPGLSLKETANGKTGPDPRQYVVVHNRLAQGLPEDPKPDGRMLRTARYKYCVYSEGKQRESLVDLEKDPREKVNLAVDRKHEATLKQHRKLLAEWCARYDDRFPLVG